jgi:hypothetical protein
MRGKLALEACAAMDTAVINQKVVHCLLDGFHGRRRSRVIEVYITTTAAINQGDEGIQTDEQ